MVAAQSASHADLSQEADGARGRAATISRSRHAKKRSAASVRKVASVSGARKSAVRRAAGVCGLKVDNGRRTRVWVPATGGKMITGTAVPNAAIKERSCVDRPDDKTMKAVYKGDVGDETRLDSNAELVGVGSSRSCTSRKGA